MASKIREVNLKEMFSYELSNTPLSYSCFDGILHKAVKSKLLEEIKNEAESVKSIPHSQAKIAWVIDGMALKGLCLEEKFIAAINCLH